MTNMVDLYKQLGTGLGDGSAERYRQMRRRLRKLSITEVSSVDRGASPGARVVFMKRADWQSPEAWRREREMERNVVGKSSSERVDALCHRMGTGDISKTEAYHRIADMADEHFDASNKLGVEGQRQNVLDRHPAFIKLMKHHRNMAEDDPGTKLRELQRHAEAQGDKEASLVHLDDSGDGAVGADGTPLHKADLARRCGAAIVGVVQKFATEANMNWGDMYSKLYKEEEAFRRLVALDRAYRGVL